MIRLSPEQAASVKQVIVIRSDLKMRRGKEIAQGSHASIAWLTGRLMTFSVPSDPDVIGMKGYLNAAEHAWVRGNFRKVCVRVRSEQELLDIVGAAEAAGLTVELIKDSGLTEFHGVETATAAAIGPDFEERIDKITGELELY